MKYHKLVRDKIPEIIKTKGGSPVIHIAQTQEYEEALSKKLMEEVVEYVESRSHEEIADILEVIHAICAFDDVGLEEIEKIRIKKWEERGGFTKRIILEES